MVQHGPHGISNPDRRLRPSRVDGLTPHRNSGSLSMLMPLSYLCLGPLVTVFDCGIALTMLDDSQLAGETVAETFPQLKVAGQGRS